LLIVLAVSSKRLLFALMFYHKSLFNFKRSYCNSSIQLERTYLIGISPCTILYILAIFKCFPVYLVLYVYENEFNICLLLFSSIAIFMCLENMTRIRAAG